MGSFSPPRKGVRHCRFVKILKIISWIFCNRHVGEIQEFKQELNSADRSKRKDAVKKVIAGKSNDMNVPFDDLSID